jgi:hypothetical protein
MKSMIMTAVFLASASVFAAGNSPVLVNGQDYTCNQLQKLLRDDGALYLSSSRGMADLHYEDPSRCDRDTRATPAYVHSSDKTFCLLGYVCVMESGT